MTNQRERILKAGLDLWPNVTAREIGRALEISHSAVLYYYKGDGLKDAVAKYAVETGNSKIIVQLLAVGHSAVKGMETELRHKYADTIR